MPPPPSLFPGTISILKDFPQSAARIFDTKLMANCLTGQEDAALIAGRVLMAWRSGIAVDFEKQVELSLKVVVQYRSLDTFEMEKLEALQEALECLKNFPYARVHAAIRLLEHLAKQKLTEVKC